MDPEKINRFLNAQNQLYLKALVEVKDGHKSTHWMWFIFPQLIHLGKSDTSKYYGLKNLGEATDYYNHPVLGKNLIEISRAVLGVQGKSANAIFGSPDDLKLHSCMTLFSLVEKADPVFGQVINKYFNGYPDSNTMEILGK